MWCSSLPCCVSKYHCPLHMLQLLVFWLASFPPPPPPQEGIPYSSKFLRHKNFMKHSKFVKFLIFVLKISWSLQSFARHGEALLSEFVAMVPCITTSHCLFLGCVPPIRSSFGWFCGHLRRWVACSLQLFCHAFVGHLTSPIQKDGIRNERGPVGLVTLPLKGWISWSKPAEYLYQFNV